MQFQVPQFIQTEDKVVGPLSLRQFFYVAIGGGISGILYFFLQPWLWAVLTVIILGAALAIAFLKIEGRPLQKVILSAFQYYWSPQTYVWQPEHPTLPQHKDVPEEDRGRLEAIAAGTTLHKSWEVVQTGAPLEKDVPKTSDKQFLEQKMAERYQIFKRLGGDQSAARRVDYR